MGNVIVDQIAPDGNLIGDVDTTLTPTQRVHLLVSALPGATAERYAGARVVRFKDQVILSAQVTYLGTPWQPYKKRIQIPRSWLAVHRQAELDGLTTRFVGVYHYGSTTIFVDFNPTTYVRRNLNNSAAHVFTNDLFQAQTLGQFSRVDRNGNRLTSVRADELEMYLMTGYEERNPHIEVIAQFSEAFLDGARIEALDAIQEMHAAGWPDKFQNEWAGFYVEFRLSQFLAERGLGGVVAVQKEKRRGQFDYDLQFFKDGHLEHYGDLKASNVAATDSPGNDAANFYRCLEECGRFWYVVYEHETWHGRDNGNTATREWNEWRRSVGHVGRGDYNPLSYAARFKEAVRFVNVKVLEVNLTNVGTVLGEFQKDFRQPDGKPRKGKVMIRKKDMENFLIYSLSIRTAASDPSRAE
ncbi:hypothetical protein [Aeromicrobium duanguangcaii]|uniref:hypothetical protein n=1 Tax=Aeromicrobium duanguangcaii TaxID=2968086 RepID=UPI00201819F4|nr:hypothetical protein [Aeromicrobium duanguangcaii]MCL3838129.1 hypothetical protein [Aeromicrobium duanguangcaii]